uniref:Uncharacterized protein n=1 Tax=Arundo donax TaxID=35708 RepID=A0A0A9HZK7_ARUDO
MGRTCIKHGSDLHQISSVCSVQPSTIVAVYFDFTRCHFLFCSELISSILQYLFLD